MRLISGVGRQLSSGIIAAGCLLTTVCALAAPNYVRVPGSTLVSRPDLQFKVAREQRGSSPVTLLLYQAASGEPSPVAVMTWSKSGSISTLSFQILLAPEDASSSDVYIGTLEHLYALAIQQDPEARYCVVSSAQPCDVAKDGASHADFLRQLALTRQGAIARAAGEGKSSLPWRVISMVREVPVGDADQVAVRVSDDHEPLEGATVFFNRAPHSGCMAKSGSNGVATCRLVDQHGEEELQGAEEKANVVATFPGDVRHDWVRVPTTFVLSAP